MPVHVPAVPETLRPPWSIAIEGGAVFTGAATGEGGGGGGGGGGAAPTERRISPDVGPSVTDVTLEPSGMVKLPEVPAYDHQV